MKKTLVAVAALVATGAFAEVTIGGNLNQAWTSTTTNGTKTTGLSAASNSSFLTFSGSEDLGSGLKASFKLEAGLGLNGAALVGGNRESWVGVSGAFGDVKAGHQYSDIFNVVVGTDPNGFNNIAGWGPGTVMLAAVAASNPAIPTDGYALVGATDSVSYTLPKFIEGVNISVQSFRPAAIGASVANVAGAATPLPAVTYGSTGSSYAVTYTNGALYAGAAGRNAGADKSTAYAASYNFGVAKIAFSNIDSTIADVAPLGAANVNVDAAGNVHTTDNTYSISAPIGDAVTVAYSAGTMKLGTDKYSNSQFGAYYNLSKRTQFYGIFGKVSGDAANANVAAGVTSTTAFGINHSF